ncbi:MAG TPA: DUF3987 domain-containing protein [Bryobacteraceae bacterium]|jgi:hypothetical protein|nr:DUF3987 domain-containing protein [Bryobacteraceae bacterium]
MPRCGTSVSEQQDSELEASEKILDCARGNDASDTPNWPAPLAREAFHGLAGHFIEVVEPYSEADPAALLVQFVVGFGNLIGRGPHFSAGADQHFTNLFSVLVGATAKARKGMSWGQAKDVLSRVDPTWAEKRVKSGLASGEGLIFALNKGQEKSLLIYEPEFSRVLRTAERTGSTLSDVIRQAWDGGNLAVLTKNNPLEVKDAFISMVAHITVGELRSLMSEIPTLNGFANRYLWVCVNRSKFLPDGGPMPQEDMNGLCAALATQLDFARSVGLMQRDAGASKLWHVVYPQLTEGKPGPFGSATARAEAQVMRLACIYALLDLSDVVEPAHLKAALAAWKYCEDSARFIFGDSVGNAVADEILKGLRDKANGGLRRTDISTLFQHNRRKEEIDAALAILQKAGLARIANLFETPGQKKPTQRWYAVC